METNQNERERQIEGLINFINSNGDSREMKRALAVKLALQGYAYKAIENILNVSQGYIAFTFETWKPISEKNAII